MTVGKIDEARVQSTYFSTEIVETADDIDFSYFYGYNARIMFSNVKGRKKEIIAYNVIEETVRQNVCRITRYLRNNSFTPIAAHFKWTCNGKHGC